MIIEELTEEQMKEIMDRDINQFNDGQIYGLKQALELMRTIYMMADANYGFPTFAHMESVFNLKIKEIENDGD